MDVHASHDLNSDPEPPGQGALVPVSFPVVVRSDAPDDSEADRLAVLWQCFCKLAWLFFLALVALRRLRIQLVELRQQSGRIMALRWRPR